jgi:nicotinamide-nucleotide amidase
MRDVHEIAQQIVKILTARRETITATESCTGGYFLASLTNIPGSSTVTEGGFITYSNRMKTALGVPQRVIDEHTVYSCETAEAMAAAGSERMFGAEMAVGITGSISRVDPANRNNSNPGVIYIAVRYHGNTRSQKFSFTYTGDPASVTAEEMRGQIKEQATAAALEMALNILRENQE